GGAHREQDVDVTTERLSLLDERQGHQCLRDGGPVCVDLDDDERGERKAELLAIDAGAKTRDDPAVDEPGEASVGGRSGDVHLLGELPHREPGFTPERGDDAAVNRIEWGVRWLRRHRVPLRVVRRRTLQTAYRGDVRCAECWAAAELDSETVTTRLSQ